MKFVFAFGSNLDVGQMSARCPRSYVAGRARLGGHRLAFAGYSARWDGAVATVIRAKGTVHGILYAVREAELERLDSFEGRMYDRVTMPVMVEARKVLAELYVQPQPELGAPSLEYVGQINRAYRAWSFDVRKLTRAVVYSSYGALVAQTLEQDEALEDLGKEAWWHAQAEKRRSPLPSKVEHMRVRREIQAIQIERARIDERPVDVLGGDHYKQLTLRARKFAT